MKQIARFLLKHRTTPHTSTKRTPAELFVGRRLRTRLDLLKPDMEDRMKQQRSPKKSYRREIENGEPVLVKDYRDNGKWIRGVIVNKLGPVTYQVQVGNLLWKRHIDQIRNYHAYDQQENIDNKPEQYNKTQSDIDMELLALPTCNSNLEKSTVEKDNAETTNSDIKVNEKDNMPTRRSTRVRNPPQRLIENI